MNYLNRDGLKASIEKAIKAASNYTTSKLNTATAKNNAQQIQALNQMKLNQMQSDKLEYGLDYTRVANIVFRCIASNHRILGLHRPENLEDVYNTMGIGRDLRLPYDSKAVFRFNARRLESDLYEGGMRRVESPRVPVERIEYGLNRILPSYMEGWLHLIYR